MLAGEQEYQRPTRHQAMRLQRGRTVKQAAQSAAVRVAGCGFPRAGILGQHWQLLRQTLRSFVLHDVVVGQACWPLFTGLLCSRFQAMWTLPKAVAAVWLANGGIRCLGAAEQLLQWGISECVCLLASLLRITFTIRWKKGQHRTDPSRQEEYENRLRWSAFL